MDLKKLIRDIPDFPKPGILFRDITPLLSSPKAFSYVISEFAKAIQSEHCSAIVAIESRGFIFGAALALREGLPFVPVRKPGKLPAEVMSVEYSLEYGSGQLEIHKDALKPGDRIVIIDDLLATGGTAKGAMDLVKLLGAEPVLFLCVIELLALQGRKVVGAEKVRSLVSY
jgi:adenine phosphoribosyltransferase